MEHWEITVEGPDAPEGLEALADWLGAEPELKGLIKPAPAVPAEGELGGLPTTLIAEAVGSGGALTALAMSLKSFFGQPRGAKVRVTVKRPDGTTYYMNLDRVQRKSVPELTAQLLKAADADTTDTTDIADAADAPEQ